MTHRWLIGTGVVVALAIALTVIATAGHDSLALNGIIYVDADAPGPTHDGSTWDYAFTTLQPALDAAGPGTQIWVAEGIYTPTEEYGGSGDRYKSFQLINGVAIYGGFDPTLGVVDFGDRDWEAHATILSGDIGTAGDSSDNSYHVFYHPDGTDLDSTAILDGFTITGGNANDDFGSASQGGGMHNYGSSPTLTNCTFYANLASTNGGGMYNSSSSTALTNATFERNSALIGGGVFNYSSSPTLVNCTFEGNTATDGGGMRNSESSPTLTDCTFVDNSASNHGGGMYNGSLSSPMLTGCTFSANSAGDGGGGMLNWSSSSPTLMNCTFIGNSADGGGGMCNVNYSSPTLTNCIFSDNWADYGGGMYNANNCSPVLTNCTFYINSATSLGGGGIYNYDSEPTVTNSVLWGDNPDEIANSNLFLSPLVTHSDIQGGYDGEGNINADPLFLDPYSWDLHLGPNSPCIDVGDNGAPALPLYDFDGDDRLRDGDGDGTAIVDMGVDEALWYPVYLPVVLRNH